MFRKSLLLITLLLLVGCGQQPGDSTIAAAAPQAAALPAGVTLIDEYDGQDNGFSIPYRKYRLDNGLTVILHEDHSDPMAHVDVTYHVGSAREEPGRSGFAHFFEHMMFEGSENVAAGEFSKLISDAGGTFNGTTNNDRTNYFETVPINQLETALWLEADRLGLLLPAVSQEEFEVQRAAVKNERGQRVDNQPYGRVSETMMKNLYPPEHPYSWPIIGWIEDLEAADLDDLKRFFLRWYGPNNATLSIGGDIDSAQTLEWVARYFGRKPRARAGHAGSRPVRDAGGQHPPARHRDAHPDGVLPPPGRSAAGRSRQDPRPGQVLAALPAPGADRARGQRLRQPRLPRTGLRDGLRRGPESRLR
jgi:zinc protease